MPTSRPSRFPAIEFFDVTVPVRPGMPAYPGDPEVRVERFSSIALGDAWNVTRLDLSAHAGTHVDAPLHVLDGAPGTDALSLDVLVGDAVVVDVGRAEGDVDARALGALLPEGTERVLLQTGDSELAPEAARLLVDRGVRLVGVDSLSVGGEETHRTLLLDGVVVLEGLDLGRVEPGRYRLLCLPLRLVDSDGAPARVVLERS